MQSRALLAFGKIATALILVLQITSARAEDWAIVIVPQLSIHDNPGGSVVGYASRGQYVTIDKYSGEWAFLDYIGKQTSNEPLRGWVELSGLQIVDKRNYTGTEVCESENRSGADVCLKITNSSMNCRATYNDEFYDKCAVEVDYRLWSNYSGRTGIDVTVECSVTIKYRTRGDSYWFTKQASAEDDLAVTANGQESGGFELDFSLSPYDEVVEARIESVVCEIGTLELR